MAVAPLRPSRQSLEPRFEAEPRRRFCFEPRRGRVNDCGSCGNLHVHVGPVSLTLSPHGYLQLLALLNTSAANIETGMQLRQQCDLDGTAEI